jgi:hypothetical protein
MPIEYNDFNWVDPPVEKEPKKFHRENHISPDMAAALARDSGTAFPVSVASHLLCCADIEDARRSIASLRRNRPEYWPARKVAPTKNYVRPLRGVKR